VRLTETRSCRERRRTTYNKKQLGKHINIKLKKAMARYIVSYNCLRDGRSLHMINVLQFYQANVAPLVRFFPILAILILWFGLVRAGFSPKARTTGLVVTSLLLVWWVASDLLGRSGFYTQHWGVMRPFCWTIAILWVIPLMRSATIGSALDALPLWLLPILQVYRAGGGMTWFGLVAAGKISPTMGLVAGIGDTTVGILAVASGVYLYSGARGGRVMAIAWNVLGLLDFAIANIVQTFLPYSLAYPAVMIPAFYAPLSVDLHALSLRQLIRAVKRERGAPTLASAKTA
jgi:hypothetical protein